MAGPKILGQLAGATSLTTSPLPAGTTLYTAPLAGAGGKGAIVSTIAVVNTTGATVTAAGRVRIVPAAATETVTHTLLAEIDLDAYETVTLTCGVTLAPGDKITVAARAGVVAHAYGTEL